LNPVINSVNYTYHNDSLGNFSLIDYLLCSPKLWWHLNNQILDHGENMSDHLTIVSFSMSFYSQRRLIRAPITFIRLLQYWYSNLQCRVKWDNVLGKSFDVLCGVRQGVLSHILLALYVDDLLMINLDAVVIISTIFYNNYRLCCIMLTTFYHFLHPVMVYRKWLIFAKLIGEI